MRRIAIAIALLLAAGQAGAGEGMWVPQQLPEIEGPLRKAGLRLRPEQLADLTGDPMGAVVSLGGCTASFVSPQGLVLTNHHCAYGAIQLNSTPENNLMQDGFVAADRANEPSAGPNARIFVLDSIRDVTAEVQDAIAAAPDAIGRERALEQIEKKLIAGCEFGEGYRCRLYSFAGGNAYRLFRNLEIRDVRLAYAPPGGIGNYGGEIDNWMWPRHTGDFSFYRAYVGPDGRPADHAPENVPYQPKHWLRFADRPLREGDFVMAAGYPGTTRRYALADEFEQTAQWSYPTISRHYKALLALVEAQGRENPDIAVKYASTVGGWRNTSKNYDGQLEGFARIDAAAAKRAEEAAVLEWLRERGEPGVPALEAHAELVRLVAEGQATRERDLVIGQFHRLGALGTAMTLYRNAIERSNPDADREPGYQERDQPRIRGELQQMDRRYHPEMDRQLQRYWLQQYLALPAGQRVEAIDDWLGGDDEQAIERALDRLAGTGMANAEERLRWLEADRDAFENSRDPAIRYAVAVMPEVLRQELERKARAGDELRARPVYLQAVADFRASQDRHVYPDANGSLRITFGNVTGYTTLDGEAQAPFTRLEEVAQKATGEEPFDAPQALLDAVAGKRHGGLADRRLRTVPVNFLSDLDVTGGNSGSPVLDARGRLTGLLFDMNWESVSSNWVFDPAMTRTISVDQRYLRWIMQEAYPAPQLLDELGLAP
ncbi:S46 family peptidase [Luteimonas sp. RD2P54]|uniref:Dipeptidyl-peptidase n=1 Tax=Luteimonas endophytica TaxID=3042023 RepID=A0ABT6J4Q4_9GAMM|nr:S46 family peptidase [Luteimonas endophytica]MDH5821790.1 S46 family peptidase [Luteimonas endophytica]